MANQSIVSGVGPYNYIVAPSGNFLSIQDAINNAVADGYGVAGTTIAIVPGTYTENLTLAANINLMGTGGEGETIIIGVHTPPASGAISFTNINFQSATDILFSAAAGTCEIKFYNCLFLLSVAGHICDLTAWTGSITIESCNESAGSIDNGIVFNNGGSAVDIIDSTVGVGVVGPTLSGPTIIRSSHIGCISTFTGAACAALITDSVFDGTITIADPAQVQLFNSSVLVGAVSCIINNSTAPVQIANTVLDSSGASVIDGSGTQLELCEVVYPGTTSSVAGTLTVLLSNYTAAGNLRTYGRMELPTTTATGAQGIIYQDSETFIHTLGTNNVFIGSETGPLTLTTANAVNNTAIGYEALHEITTGARNTTVGTQTLPVTTGTNNIAIGNLAGSALVLAESNNIMIGSIGVVGDNQTIRLGTAQTSNYQEGIYQASSGATKEVVYIDSNHKLSSSNLGVTQWAVATTSLTAAINTGYIVVNTVPANLLVITLPAVSAVGDIIEITGLTVGMWQLVQQAGQTMHYSGIDTTPGIAGSISATTRYDSIRIICTVASAEWNVLSSTGTFIIV